MSNQPAILMFIGDEYEDLEVWYPKLRLIEAGYQVVCAGLEANVVYKGKHGYPCKSDATIKGQKSSDYAGVICPGGWMPDKIRRDPHVKLLLQEFAAAGKLVAAICHGGWMPISAGIYRNVRTTGSLGIKDDLENAGALFLDQEVVVDRNFVSSRKPDDLPAFAMGCLEVLGKTARGEMLT
ncbi:MAG: protease [Planctomyces sp.]|jgi:protease I|nr:protease [Planctomyces sp.]